MASSKKSRSERPADGDPGSGYGPNPSGDYGPPQGFGALPGYGPPGGFGGPVDAPVLMRADGPARARTGLVVLVAFLFELVVIAALGNQAVTDRVNDHLDGVHSLLGRNLLGAGLTFQWRFGPRFGDDPGHVWLAQLMLVVAFLVVSTLLIIPAVRGVVTFWRAFFSTWTAVAAAALVAAMVRGAIVSPGLSGTGDKRVDNALFGQAGPNTYVVVGGIAFGLVVALLVAIVATASRRTTMVPVTAAPAEGPPPAEVDVPPPFYGVPASDSSRTQVIDTGSQTAGYGFEKAPPGMSEGARHAADASEANDSSTTRRLPAMDFASAAPAPPAAEPEPIAEPEVEPAPAPAPSELPSEPDAAPVPESVGRTDSDAPSDVTTQFPRPVTGGYTPPEPPQGSGQIEEEPGAATAPTDPADAADADATSHPRPTTPETTRFADPPG